MQHMTINMTIIKAKCGEVIVTFLITFASWNSNLCLLRCKYEQQQQLFASFF